MNCRFLCAAFAASILAGCGGGDSDAPTASAAAATTSAATPAEASPTLRGRVTLNGEPVAQAFLLLRVPGSDELPELDPAQLFSDAEGRFAITVPAGRYTVTAVAEQGTATVAADTGAAAELSLALQDDHEQRLRELIERGPAEPSEGE